MSEKRILITGGAGFIGSHLIDGLKKEDPKSPIMVIDDCSRTLDENRRRVQKSLNRDDTFHRVDLASKKARTLIADFAPTQIVHLAAQMSIVKSLGDPSGTLHPNIMGTQNLINGLRDVAPDNTAQIIFASSGGSVYGDTYTIPTPEHTGLNPKSPYAWSKAAGESLLKMYRELGWFGVLTVLRLSNVYGPRQNTADSASVIQTVLEKIQKDEPFQLIGETKNTRDYVYVGDVVSAIMISLQRKVNGTFNIGTGVERSVEEIMLICETVTGQKITRDTSRQAEGKNLLARSCLKIEKAQHQLGWHPRTNLEAGISHIWQELNP